MRRLHVYFFIINFGIVTTLHNSHLQLIVDYAKWRNVKSLIIFDELMKSRNLNLLSTFSDNDLFYTLQTSRHFFIDFVMKNFQKITIVAFIDNNNNFTLVDEIFTKFNLFKDNLLWLIITQNDNDDDIFDRLKVITLSYNSDLVIARFKNENDDDYTKSNISHYSFSLIQFWKLRKETDISLIKNPFGTWSQHKGMIYTLLKPIEKRNNFLHKFPIKFGLNNESFADGNSENFVQFADYFSRFIVAKAEYLHYTKLGYKENDGGYTDLLKAVIGEEIDVGLDRVIQTTENFADMAFTHTILTSMHNIYIKPQESNELRDIFLVPFSNCLIFCVVATGIIFCIFMAFSNEIELGEAAIWCVGIFSMQGSVCIPHKFSGNIILITSLSFSLVIYNSYSAFITSILSVEIANIKTIDDLLTSNYNIGYVKNSQDEIYLRSMNDSQLQQIYLRGYLQNSVSNVSDGLLKTMKGHYGFFTSINEARKEILTINNYRCHSDLMEIPIRKTRNIVAFPMAKNSPYRKIINLGIIKMYETGIHKYFQRQIVPDLLKCERKIIFRSAHFSDLTSAFAILIIGFVMAFFIVILECLWKKKRRIYKIVKRRLHAIK